MLTRLNSLWVGNRLGYLEQLCLRSAVSLGHPFTLYSYMPDQLVDVPPGVDVADAADIMPEDRLLRYSDTGSVQLGANFWRCWLLEKGVGYWVDMDLIFLRPLDFEQSYVFGWEYENWINNALLWAPADSPFVRDLIDIPKPNRRPPWYGPRRSLAFYWQRFRKGRIGLEDMPWGTYSSGLVTYLVKKHKLTRCALPPHVFYPVRWKDARTLYDPAAVVEAMLHQETRTVHMWNSRLVGLSDKPPPDGSYVDVQCRLHGVDVEAALEAH